MAPVSQAQELVRTYTHLPEPCPPTSWTTTQPAGPIAAAAEPFTFDQDYALVARDPVS